MRMKKIKTRKGIVEMGKWESGGIYSRVEEVEIVNRCFEGAKKRIKFN